MSTPTPFQISVPDSSISLLQQKLALVTFPDELEGAGWSYGAPLADIQRLVARWKEGYDWRKHEEAINQEVPMFTIPIKADGFGALEIHFAHKKSDVGEGAIPLLFVHGWPGHFLEARKLLPLLTAAPPEGESTESFPSFHVVSISLPNFGFSEGVKEKGFNLDYYAEVCHKLMLALGYNEYVTQGGDWGGMITRRMAQKYGPTYVKAWHTNFPIAGPPTLFSNPFLWLQLTLKFFPSSEDIAGFRRTLAFRESGNGYFSEQSTQPQTLGYGLADSPVALLAWIYEKLVNWTDEYKWDDDEVLTWISLYWFSRAGPAASVRIYYEFVKAEHYSKWPRVANVPLGLSYFPKELIAVPKSWSHMAGNVVFLSKHDKGGHFAAHEEPELLAGDLRKMFGKGGPAYGVVQKKDGYSHYSDADVVPARL